MTAANRPAARGLIWRLALCSVAALAPAAALANAAMGLGLEMFEFRLWLIYVVVTVVFEAWWIGRRRGRGWISSIGASVVGNAITALCCPQLAVPFLHTSFVGSRLIPNAFGNALAIFLVFGLVSAIIEAAIWDFRDVRAGGHGSVMKSSLLGHLVGVPIALAILLIPSHPYIGLEATTEAQRLTALRNWATQELAPTIAESRKVPNVRSVSEAFQLFGKQSDWAPGFVYQPGRFDMGENRSHPLEWNVGLSGKPIEGADKPRWVWLIRPPREVTGYRFDIFIDMSSGDLKLASEDYPPTTREFP